MAINPNRSDLDQQQIFQRAFDEPNDRIRVDAEVTATIGELSVIIDSDTDNIAIRNTNDDNELLINPDGSINVNTSIVDPANFNETLQYNEISSIISGSETNVLTYTVPASKIFYLHRVEVSGDNLATYRIKINNVVKTKKRTWWTEFNETFDYITSGNNGLKLSTGDVLNITVIHNSSALGAFNASLQGVEVG